MMACPACGCATEVKETRSLKMADGTPALRRRRYCTGLRCEGKLTTYEVASNLGRTGKAIRVVPAGMFAELQRIARQLLDLTGKDDDAPPT